MESPTLRWIEVHKAGTDYIKTHCFAWTKWKETFIVFWRTHHPTPIRLFRPPPLYNCLRSFTFSSPHSSLSLPVLKESCCTLTSLRFTHACLGHYITIIKLLVQEIKDEEKWGNGGGGVQMKCRSVKMRSGKFLSLFPSARLHPWAKAKEAKRDEGRKCASPTPATLQLHLAQTGRLASKLSPMTVYEADSEWWEQLFSAELF